MSEPSCLYASHFGLKTEPFSIAPDPRYLFMSERHRDALAHLLYGVNGGGGFVLLTGEIGAGKTTVCRAFLEQIPRRCNVAYIFNPRLTVPELLQTICEEFRIPVPVEALDTNRACILALNEFLLRTHAVGQNNVLIIDEAQNLDVAVLEQLRLLTNLETNERKLLQIILIGQPELRQMLQRPDLEQLAQRVIARFHLDALSPGETAQYIRHRLAIAGLPDSELFEAKAAARVHQLTAGVPRRINLLCDRALLGTFATGQRTVSRAVVDQAATEVFDLDRLPNKLPSSGGWRTAWRDKAPWAWGVMALGALIAVGGVAASQGGWRWPAHWMDRAPAAVTSTSAPTAMATSASSSAPSSATTLAITRPKAPAAATPVRPQALAPTLAPRLVLSGDVPRRLDVGVQALAQRWDVNVSAADACAQAARARLQCFNSSAGLSLIRQLGRPVVLHLLDDDGAMVYGLLTHLSDTAATVVVGAQVQTVSLTALSLAWRGDFTTLWRAPEGYRQKLVAGSKGPAVDWLASQLAQVQGTDKPESASVMTPVLQSRLSAFQVSQGIKPDGMAGAMTFMQLNRLTGVPEPRLNPEP